MISFIIPTLNEEKVIEKLLRNLREIKTFEYEIIVSDGGSTDKTVEIAKNIADKVVEHSAQTRQNISQGRNAGAAVARGEFVVFLDADVHIENPDAFFKAALKQFSQEPKLAGLTVTVKVYPNQATLADNIIFGVLNFNLTVKNNIFHVGDSTGEFQMIRKNVFDSIHGFREDLVTREDADMFWRLSNIARTMLYGNLTVFHSGRRAHKVGWPRLLWTWAVNTAWVTLFDRAASKEWTVIR
jgi:glycosyltransferase involved in cell wall biosynthesis